MALSLRKHYILPLTTTMVRIVRCTYIVHVYTHSVQYTPERPLFLVSRSSTDLTQRLPLNPDCRTCYTQDDVSADLVGELLSTRWPY